jgi:hypothetical protein
MRGSTAASAIELSDADARICAYCLPEASFSVRLEHTVTESVPCGVQSHAIQIQHDVSEAYRLNLEVNETPAERESKLSSVRRTFATECVFREVSESSENPRVPSLNRVSQWSSTWSSPTPGGRRKYLTSKETGSA